MRYERETADHLRFGGAALHDHEGNCHVAGEGRERCAVGGRETGGFDDHAFSPRQDPRGVSTELLVRRATPLSGVQVETGDLLSSSARGEPGEECLDVHGYVSLLDTTIDKMLGNRHE